MLKKKECKYPPPLATYTNHKLWFESLFILSKLKSLVIQLAEVR